MTRTHARKERARARVIFLRVFYLAKRITRHDIHVVSEIYIKYL